jgi:purine nucleoside phosphorylase
MSVTPEQLNRAPELAEPVRAVLIDGSITYNVDLISRAEYAFTAPTPAGESPPFYLIRQDDAPFWYVNFHGVDFLSASDNVEVGFTRTWYVIYQLGVEMALSGAAVGSLLPELKPRDLVLMTDFIDLSTHRPRSMLLEIWEKSPYLGAELVPPVCPELSKHLLDGSRSYPNGRVHHEGILAQFEGHRFETPAEIRMAQALGAGMVAHHQASEAIYARELGIHFAALAYVSNIGAGLSKGWEDGFVSEEEAREDYALTAEILVQAAAAASRKALTCRICRQNPDHQIPANLSNEKELYR